jgi:hypothetical protein
MSDRRLQFTPEGATTAAAPLRSLFRALTQATLASTMAVGCDTDGADVGTPEGDGGSERGQDASRDVTWDARLAPGFEEIACGSVLGNVAELQAAPKTTQPVDYLGAYVGEAVRVNGSAQQTWTTELARWGEPCSGVADPAACEAQLSSLRAALPCGQAPCDHFLIVQQGGSLSRLDARADVLALLGGIDTKSEASLLAALSGQPLCDLFSRLPGASIAATARGYEIRVLHDRCSDGQYRDRLTVDGDGTLTVLEHVKIAPSTCAIGRRPDGLCTPPAATRTSARGEYLAEAAHLEAASVYAFEKLARELLALSAPRALVEAAREAMSDEIRHALVVGALARASDGQPSVPVVEETPLRSRLELALDNASEGCVRETFGALVATYQAESASDARVRAIMATIAEDETRHAALSWALQAWLEAGLSEGERAQVASAQAHALDALARELDPDLSDADLRMLGLPSQALSCALLAGLKPALPWTGNR